MASGRLRYSRNRFGPADLDLADGLVVAGLEHVRRRRRRAAARPRRAAARPCPGRRSPSARHGGVHQRLGHAVALDDALAGRALRSARGRRPAAPPSRRPAAARRRSAVSDLAVVLGVGGETVVHRRDAEEHRRAGPPARRAAACEREAPEVADRAAEAQRAEHAEDQPVDVEQRQPVDEHVVAGPRPRLASASRLEAIARRGSTTPFGGPVVPEV